jgi:hypothetical protein
MHDGTAHLVLNRLSILVELLLVPEAPESPRTHDQLQQRLSWPGTPEYYLYQHFLTNIKMVRIQALLLLNNISKNYVSCTSTL